MTPYSGVLAALTSNFVVMLNDIHKTISAAAKSPLGIWALIIFILGAVALAFFRESPLPYKVGIYILMFFGLGIFGLAASRTKAGASDSPTDVPDDSKTSHAHEVPQAAEHVGLALSEPRRLLESANRYYRSGRHDKAREAFAEARTLFRAVKNR
ncbi:MAG: hypothetical protein J4F49_09230, partial [Rhodobacteraceae bacterium]|nr:hypothetical protein [Paracoccaceae bacterium]